MAILSSLRQVGRMLRHGGLVTAGLALPISGALAANPGPSPQAIDALFAPHVRVDTPGCALGVFQNGAMVYENGYGLADLNQNIPITPETVFYIASTSKQFTGFAVALLAEKGTLSLDDPIRKHLPELPAWADNITVDQLVHHTSGIPDYLSLWEVSGRSSADEIPLPQAIELIGRQPDLMFGPGTDWSYSNSNYLLLAEIVARVTGRSLRAYAEEAMFAPLGMTATAFHDDATRVVPRRAEGYYPNGAGGFIIARTSFALVGDGGLLTNVRDLLKWDANFYANRLGGGEALIGRVTTPRAPAKAAEPAYAFGLQVGNHRGLPMIEHGGSFIGFTAQMVRFPTEHLSVAVLCNSPVAPAPLLALQVADLYLPGGDDAPSAPPVAAAAPATVTLSQEALARWAGRYYIEPPGLTGIVAVNGEGLELRFERGNYILTPISADTFTAPGVPRPLRFVPGDDGVPSLLIEGSAPARRLDDLPLPTPEALAAYAGRYESDQIDTWFELRASGGRLEMKRRYQASWLPMQPLDRDRFAIPGRTVSFSRTPQGNVEGFSVSSQRLADIRFEKAR